MSEYTTRQILDMIEANGGPEGLDLSGKDFSEIDLRRETIQDELGQVREDDPKVEPVWVSPVTNGINLQGVNLELANLQGASLWWADLQVADLGGANLQSANLLGANLQHACLQGANLTRVYLIDAGNIEGICLYRAILDHTQLTKDQLGGAIGEEIIGIYAFQEEDIYLQAKEAYLALKNNFEQIGRYDDAAWAYCKERRTEKLEALQKAKCAFRTRDWRKAARNYAKVAGDQLVELMCDYGESFWRVLGVMLAVWFIFALIYGLIAGVWGPWQEMATRKIRYITRNPFDLLSFSLGVMTTLTPIGLGARSMLAMHILMPLEALLGIALAGLLGFVAGNRIRRS